MTKISLKAPLLAGLFLLSGFIPLSASAGDIGHVNEVFKFAYGTPPGGTKAPLYRLDGVVANQTVETVDTGGLQIIFQDKTDLRMGSNSKLVIDQYVYDPSNPNQAGVFQMASGAFRFVTGQMESGNIRLETPTATIGIRGTDVVVNVTEGQTDLEVLSGGATLTNKSDGSTVDVPAGKKASTGTGRSASVTGNASQRPHDNALQSKGERRSSSRSTGSNDTSTTTTNNQQIN